jgi:hypothetical protein
MILGSIPEICSKKTDSFSELFSTNISGVFHFVIALARAK